MPLRASRHAQGIQFGIASYWIVAASPLPP
jgi:hypothetical protein